MIFDSLPPGWAITKLEDLVSILDSMREPVNNSERQHRIEGKPDSELFPYYGATGEVGKIDGYLFDEELVALGEDGVPFLDAKKSKAYMLNGKTWVNNHAHVLKAIDGITTNSFILNFLNQFDYQGYVNGGTRLKLTQANMRQIPVPLPSLAEQQQIAAKLDELLAQVDTLKIRLNTIPKILKRFRQSVLAAAVSGKLTEDWRNDEKYIKTEYGWNIPSEWQLLVIDDIAEVKGGKRLPKVLVSENTGFPYIRAGQLKDGTVIDDDQLFLLKHVQAKISRYIVNTGDLYITIVGACIGDAGIIPSNYDGANLTENAAKLCLFKKPLKKQFLSSWLRSQYLQDIVQHEIKSGAQGKLALKRIKTLPFPYPSIEEQNEIVRRVEQLFTYADQIEQRVKDAQSRVNHLTQAILAKAFRGELTADWREQNLDLISGENSAEALLARIKAERQELETNKVTNRRILKKPGESMKPKGIVPIIEALKAAGQPLSSQDLLVQSGYPNDATTEQLEAFFLDIREQLNAKTITRNRQGDKEFFAIAES